MPGLRAARSARSGSSVTPRPGRHQGLRRDEVVGGERDPRGEPGRRALLQQVLAAAVAPGDPPVLRQPGQVGGPQLGHRGRQRRLAAAHGRVGHDQVHCLGQQYLLADAIAVRRWTGSSSCTRRAPCPAPRPTLPALRPGLPWGQRRRPAAGPAELAAAVGARAGRSAPRRRTRRAASAPPPAARPRSAAGQRSDAGRAGSRRRPARSCRARRGRRPAAAARRAARRRPRARSPPRPAGR